MATVILTHVTSGGSPTSMTTFTAHVDKSSDDIVNNLVLKNVQSGMTWQMSKQSGGTPTHEDWQVQVSMAAAGSYIATANYMSAGSASGTDTV